MPLELPFPASAEAAREVRHVGQVFTPQPIAALMAEMFDPRPGDNLRALDAGAGAGALTDALLSSRLSQSAQQVNMLLAEVDELLCDHLEDAVADWERLSRGSVKVLNANFISFADQAKEDATTFDAIISNPPYARIGKDTPERHPLKARYIRVPNLYGAFLWLSVELLAPQGQLVAIVPRSFCSGPQFAELRRKMFSQCSLRRLHLFQSRTMVFPEDRVLQETVILHLVRDTQADNIELSWSPGLDLQATHATTVPSDRVLQSQGNDYFITIPASPEAARQTGRAADHALLLRSPVTASTGSVVDFRMKDYIVEEVDTKNVPLIGSPFVSKGHRSRRDGRLYLKRTDKTQRHIFPIGNYIVVKRIAPKESTPRLMARLVTEQELRPHSGVAFENHVNVIHAGRKGLSAGQAQHIMTSLAHPATQQQFEERSGTTQVNVSDLLSLHDPLEIRNKESHDD
ncbi:Eco57I restriction-modification methylase domain-containing protein [Modestobacter caceresii]|uniref:Eco57I restriction-modification methylase domain-containing protein n=1 Tax=Modestobacter caceresii TaxID=1522368 RepID=UPI0009DE80E3|nr:Eco57I restriction-modification methylase domain-containing protein [Modestobacter caceresii]